MNLPKFSDLDPRILALNNYLPGARDKFGRSIRFHRSKNGVPNVNGFTVENLTKYVTWINYVGMFNDGIDGIRNGICMVTDMEGYGWKNFDADFQKQTATLFTENFPLLMRKILTLNPPGIFTALVKIMKTIMKHKIFERYEVLQVKDFGKFIEPDNLLAEYGGNVNCTYQDWYKIMGEWAERCEERLIAPGRE